MTTLESIAKEFSVPIGVIAPYACCEWRAIAVNTEQINDQFYLHCFAQIEDGKVINTTFLKFTI